MCREILFYFDDRQIFTAEKQIKINRKEDEIHQKEKTQILLQVSVNT